MLSRPTVVTPRQRNDQFLDECGTSLHGCDGRVGKKEFVVMLLFYYYYYYFLPHVVKKPGLKTKLKS